MSYAKEIRSPFSTKTALIDYSPSTLKKNALIDISYDNLKL